METEYSEKSEYLEAISKMIKNTTKIAEKLAGILRQFDYTKIINNFIFPFYELSLEIEEAKKNPESLINYLEYVNKLSNYYWAMPYKIKGENLKEIFEQINSEQEFDVYMSEYFSDDKIENIFADIQNKISENHRVVFEQIIEAFKLEYYALINNAIISIIDDELSFYIKDKRVTTRNGLFEPILERLKRIPIGECNWINIIFLEILDNNIKTIFQKIKFDNIEITTKKQIRRHTTQHGKLYSNERIDTLMLINTLYNILNTKEYLLEYEVKLKYSRKEEKFIFIDK